MSIFSALIIWPAIFILVQGFDVTVKHNGPVVIGGTIQFWVKVSNQLFGEFRYVWHDNAAKKHSGTLFGDNKAEWNITYENGDYEPNLYTVSVEVCEKTLIWYPCEKASASFNITGDLNGKFLILQNNTIQNKPYISNSTEVEHRIDINEPDLTVLKDNNFTIATYWFMNCSWLAMTRDLTFRYNYTVADEDVVMKGIVLAVQLNDTINATDVLPEAPWSNATLKLSANSSIEKDNNNIFVPWPDGSCNGSFIPVAPGQLYGYFHHVVKPRRPVQVTNVEGNNWLKNGDLLNLTINFVGTPPYSHCFQFIVGEYNATGNETCLHSEKTTSGKINVIHYFGIGNKHTVLFILQNVVSKTSTAVVVTNYMAKKHPQLSVIIVPISCSAIAVILIVFGVAYYIQNRNRYTVEVADFDFSASNDTEYKSFRERLREAVSSAFTRVTEEEQDEGSSYWSPSRNNTNKPVLLENSDSDTSVE